MCVMSIAQMAHGFLQGPYGKLQLLYSYGSRLPAADMDFLAVYDGVLSAANMMLGRVDLWAISMSDFRWHIQMLDPLVTEPILTGIPVFGGSSAVARARADLRRAVPSEASTAYLLQRSAEAYIYAVGRTRDRRDCSQQERRLFWSNLSFSISYWAFAHYYATRGRGPVVLQRLLGEASNEIRELWHDVMLRKKGRDQIDLQILDAWARHLLHAPAKPQSVLL